MVEPASPETLYPQVPWVTHDLRFAVIMAEIKAMHDQKQADYGTDADPWANVRASEPYGIPAWVHASTLVDHKSKRIQAFVSKGKLENEGVRDSLLDRAVYAIAAVVLFDEAPVHNEARTVQHFHDGVACYALDH